MWRKSKFALGFLLLSGCATVPEGPSIVALPGTGKTFEEFRAADDACRQDALEQVRGVTPDLASTETDQKSAAAGTAVGAAKGASIDDGEDAVTGLGTGSEMRPDIRGLSPRDLQHRYDSAYVKCMYTKGHRVPISGRMIGPSSQTYYRPSSGSAYSPPDVYPTTPPRESWYAPPPDFYPTPPAPSYR